jgi:hypothetical protein
VEISRAGLRFPWAFLSTGMTLWLLSRWMRTHDRRDALFCGLAIGLGLNGYSPYRVTVLAVCLGLLIAVIAANSAAERRRVVGDSLLIGATAGLIFLPLGRYALEHPDMFWSRAGTRLSGDVGSNGDSPGLSHQLSVFLHNNWNAALGFNWRGDSTMVNSFTYAPILDLLTGALFLAGLGIIFTHIARCRDLRAAFLVAAMPILVLTSTLALAFPIENPSVNREATLVPVVFTIAALPMAALARQLRARFGRLRGNLILAPAAAAVIVISANLNYEQYFQDFDNQTSRSGASVGDIADAIRGAEIVGVQPDEAYIIDYPYWLDIRNIGINMGNIGWAPAHNVRVEDPLPVQQPGRPLLLIFNLNDTARLEEAKRTYPDYYISTYPTENPEQAFIVFVVFPVSTSP